jgi:predicted HicB family RNase H-like nuclease
MMPDPEYYADCLRESLDELKKAFQLESEEIVKAPAVSKSEPRKKAGAKKTTRKKKARKSPTRSKKVSTKRA